MHDKLVIKADAIDTKIPDTSELVTKTQKGSNKQALEKNIKDVDKKYLILVSCSKRLTTTQKLQRLTTRYLVLLD